MITIEEFKKKHSKKVRFIGLDLGSKRILIISKKEIKTGCDIMRLALDEVTRC